MKIEIIIVLAFIICARFNVNIDIMEVKAMSLKLNKLSKLNKFSKVKGLKQDYEDNNDKTLCSCKEIDKDYWKSLICIRSCEDFCSELEEVKNVCVLRCEKHLCSQINQMCDIADDNGIGSCLVSTANTVDT